MAQIVTDAQRAAFEPYVRAWMRDEFSGTRVTPVGRAEVVAGLRQCYEAAGLLAGQGRVGALAGRG